ncbi:MAG TPA: type IV pilin protein [Oleiagrimonas sp.]|nr:type IV pilin protein [Oleiagrimonas sp.]
MARSRGFTLLELMIVVAIVAILAAIAYPSYTHYIVKTHRAAAEACLSEYANYMERFYTTNLSYANDTDGNAAVLPTLNCASAGQTGDNYGYALVGPTDSTYSVTAAPSGAQAARDTKCGTLSLDQAGQRGVTGNGGVANCW